MVKRMIKTIYPTKIEESYASNIKSLVSELNELILYEFDNVIAPQIKSEKLLTDELVLDSFFFRLKKSVNKMNSLALGAFPNTMSKKAATRYAFGISTVNKTNIDNQLTTKGFNRISSENWLKPFLDTKIEENVSYITKIRDDQVANIEQIIYRGVSKGQSVAEMREQILEVSDKSLNQADFIARDQTGTLLGQLTAERHKNAGIRAFRWSDSGDIKVRDSHAERNDKIFFYSDNPLLPGEDYGCRCVAEMVDEFDDDYVEALKTRK